MAKHLFGPGNPGRPKGAKNKFKLTTMRELFQNLELDLAPLILKEIFAIENRETKVTLLLRLYGWVEPKVQKFENVGERPHEESILKDKQVDDLLAALRSTIEDKERESARP